MLVYVSQIYVLFIYIMPIYCAFILCEIHFRHMKSMLLNLNSIGKKQAVTIRKFAVLNSMVVVGFTERVPFEKRCEGGVRHEAVCKNIPGWEQQIGGHQGQTCQVHLRNNRGTSGWS